MSTYRVIAECQDRRLVKIVVAADENQARISMARHFKRTGFAVKQIIAL